MQNTVVDGTLFRRIHSIIMSDYPKPEGWSGGKEGGYLNTFHGHVSSKYDRASAPISPAEAANCTDDLNEFAHEYDDGADETGSDY